METNGNGKPFTRQCQCQCGGQLETIDSNGLSSTARCADCGHCSLIVRGRHQIKLRDFHLKRGGDYRPLNDLKMAERLVRALRDDMWPSSAAITDFGIIDSRHLGALQSAVRAGATAYDLDRVLGDGPAITELVRKVSPGNPYGDVSFETVWDALPWPSDADDEESEDEVVSQLPNTRAQEIADGGLVDVSEIASEYGIRYPTALTREVWDRYVRFPADPMHERARLVRAWERLSNILFDASQKDFPKSESASECFSTVLGDDVELVKLRACFGSGDNGKPVITITTMPGEN